MAYLGLVTNERSTGQAAGKARSPNAATGHARLFLIEAAHHYRLPPQIGMNPRVRHFITEVLRIPWCFGFCFFATLWTATSF